MAQFTTAQVATKFETDTRTLRKFLRADAKANEATTPGKGARYLIEGKELRAMKSRFTAWGTAQADAKAAKAEAKVEEVTPEVEAEDEAMQAHLDEDEEPTDADIEAMADLELDD